MGIPLAPSTAATNALLGGADEATVRPRFTAVFSIAVEAIG